MIGRGVPDTVLAYAKLEDPIGDFEKLMGSGDAWQSPQRMSAKTRRQSEKNLKQADKEIGLQDGSMDSWMRSIGSIELALFDLDFGETMFDQYDGQAILSLQCFKRADDVLCAGDIQRGSGFIKH